LKVSKKTWLVIGTGIFIIALAALGIVSFRQVHDKNQLNELLVSSQSVLQRNQFESLSSQQTELEERLSQITPEFEAVKAKLSQPVSSTAAASALFDVAKTYGLVVIEMTSSSPTNESVEGVTLSAMSVTAKVEGNMSKIGDFITALNNLLKTSAVKSVEITAPEMTNGDNASASIQLVVYTYRGE
jgi:uncharacterized small protein (DUF1192 family)/phosphohistidine swiveling domain-containing protein